MELFADLDAILGDGANDLTGTDTRRGDEKLGRLVGDRAERCFTAFGFDLEVFDLLLGLSYRRYRRGRMPVAAEVPCNSMPMLSS